VNDKRTIPTARHRRLRDPARRNAARNPESPSPGHHHPHLSNNQDGKVGRALRYSKRTIPAARQRRLRDPARRGAARNPESPSPRHHHPHLSNNQLGKVSLALRYSKRTIPATWCWVIGARVEERPCR